MLSRPLAHMLMNGAHFVPVIVLPTRRAKGQNFTRPFPPTTPPTEDGRGRGCGMKCMALMPTHVKAVTANRGPRFLGLDSARSKWQI